MHKTITKIDSYLGTVGAWLIRNACRSKTTFTRSVKQTRIKTKASCSQKLNRRKQLQANNNWERDMHPRSLLVLKPKMHCSTSTMPLKKDAL
jgi:hypothetical protein